MSRTKINISVSDLSTMVSNDTGVDLSTVDHIIRCFCGIVRTCVESGAVVQLATLGKIDYDVYEQNIKSTTITNVADINIVLRYRDRFVPKLVLPKHNEFKRKLNMPTIDIQELK